MKTLNLVNLEHEFVKVNKSKKEIYYNEEMNNMIVFCPYDSSCNTESICNGISDEAYENVISELNNHNDIVVFWSQIEGTTSDYTIYHDVNPEELLNLSFKEIVNLLDSSVTGGRMGSYKYTEVIDGIESKIAL